MGKLLNNPLFVGLLVLAAVAAASWNMLWPALKSLRASRLAPAGLEPFPREEGGEAKEAKSRIDLAGAGWIDWPRRDPFQPPLIMSLPRLERGEAAPPAAEAGAPAAKQRMLRAMERFRLAAVVIEPGLRYATINGSPVSEGGMIDDYKVVRIDPDAVLISGPLGQERLTFGPAAKASAMAPKPAVGTVEETVDEEK